MEKKQLKPTKPEKAVTAVYLPVSLRDKLDTLAKTQGVSRSFVVRNVMAGWLQDIEAAP
jgi:predicted DNA-binding protein